MGKKLKQTITIGTALASSVLMANAQEVKANEIPAEQTTPDSGLVIKTKEGKTTAKDVEVAKQEADIAKAKQTEASKTVEAKTEKAKTADEKVSKLEDIKAKAGSITDETIKGLETEIDKTKVEKADKEKELADKKSDVETKTTKAEAAKKNLADTNASITEKTTKSNTIKEQIKDLQKVDETLAEKKDDKEMFQRQVDDLTKVRDEKANKLKEAQEKDKTITDEIDKTAEQMNTQKEVLDKAKTDSEDAKAKETEAKVKLTSGDKIYKYGKKDIALDPRFVEAYKKYKKKEITLEQLIEVEKTVLETTDFIYEKNQEGDETVDVNNLSEKDKEEFSQYFVYLLNQVRAQFGLEPRKVNKNTQKFADDVAKYSRTSTFTMGGHDKESIKKAARDNGLEEGQFYENLITNGSTTDIHNSVMTKRQLFNELYNNVLSFFYEGHINNHYAHANSLLKDDEPTTAVSFSYKTFDEEGENYKNYYMKYHVISVDPDTVKDKATAEARFGKDSKDNLDLLKVPTQAELQQAYETAKADAEAKANKVVEEQAKYDALVKKLNDYKALAPESEKAQQELDAANNELKQAQRELDGTIVAIKALEDQKATADEKVKKLQAELDTLTQELADLTTSIPAKQTAVDSAEAEVQTAKTEVATVEEELKAIQDKLANLTEEHASAVELKAKYDTIVKSLEIAKEELALAKDELDLAKEKLVEAKAEATVKYDNYVGVLKQYELETLVYAVDKDAPVLEKPEFDIKSLNNPTNPTSPINSTNPVNPINSANSTNPTESVSSINSPIEGEKGTLHTKEGAILPNTGINAKSSVFAGIIMLVASLIMSRRKIK